MAEIGSGTWSETPANNNAASPNGWLTGMLPSAVEPVAREEMSALKKWWNRSNAVKVSGGTANAQTLTYDVAEAQYYTGQCFAFIVGAALTNTASATLNVSGLGAKTIKFGTSTLAGGELQAGMAALVAYDGTSFQLLATGGRTASATFSASPSNPTVTSSATAVMMGMGGTCTITPKKSGVVRFFFDAGAIVGGANGGWAGQIRYGTGAAPANGAALTGTAVGTAKSLIIPDAQVHPMPFAALVTGLTVGTAYWFDLAVGTVSGSTTAGIQQVYAEAVEL